MVENNGSDEEDAHAWGIPIPHHVQENLTDEEYLSMILGPKRMGYEVRFRSEQ